MRAHSNKNPVLLLVKEELSGPSGMSQTFEKNKQSWLDARARRIRALLVLQSRRESGQITKRPSLMRV